MGGVLACVKETPHWAAEKDGRLSNQCHGPHPTTECGQQRDSEGGSKYWNGGVLGALILRLHPVDNEGATAEQEAETEEGLENRS